VFGVGRGIEGLGIGDADLMMMAGSFVGWQVILIGFFAGVLPALIFGIVQVFSHGKQAMPFGPSLAVGVMISLLCWRWIGPIVWPTFSEPMILGFFAVVMPTLLLVIAFLLRLVRGNEPLDDTDQLVAAATSEPPNGQDTSEKPAAQSAPSNGRDPSEIPAEEPEPRADAPEKPADA
jgi:hypothetical protein